MLEKDDAATSDGAGGTGDSGVSFSGPCPSPVPRKTFSRSATWSDSRTMLPPHGPNGGNDSFDPNEDNGGRGRFEVPSNLRTRGNLRARSHLPPLQPLAISHGRPGPAPGSDDIGKFLPCTPGGRDMSDGGERSKLNLSSIRGDPYKNTDLFKKHKVAIYKKECSKVAEHIYLGGNAVARDRKILGKHAITHILNCVGFVCPEYFKADFVYHTLWLHDRSSEDITSILYDVFDYFEYVREQQGHVFVHCCQGISRSTSLVIAYLMWREGKCFDEAFQYVKAAREIADPNMGFACQLLQCQKRVHAFPLSPNSLLRMYRIAFHSPYDPLHLVPKMLNSPTPAALDSRGAFIIQISSAIYVWIGLKCENVMEGDARGAVCQIVRYEKLRGPIVAIKEGDEPSYFWDAFSSMLPLMGKSSNGVDVTESSKKIIPGERKVSSYDVEFEIFQKAIVGGFFPPSALFETDHETHLPVRESCWSALRRQLTSGSMKEFASASKPYLSRFYPDSVLKLCAENRAYKTALSHMDSLSSSSSTSLISFSSSSTKSSSSPLYLSPNSMSSNSSMGSKYFSDSPSMVAFGNSLAVDARSLPNLSIHPGKLSPQSLSTRTESVFSQSGSPPSKKPAFSIAECRGGMEKNLEFSTDFSGPVDCNSACPMQNQLVVYRWPSLEKIVTFSAADLDSKDIFILVVSASGLRSSIEHRVLYFWIGKCCSDGNSKMLLKADQDTGELKVITWNEVCSDVVTKMGLPNDTDVKIVKQDEEPEEFLALLGSL